MKILPLLPFLAAALLSAQPPPPLPLAKPEDVGLSAERLQRVDTFVERLQAEHQISGAVAIVARRGKLVLLRAQGYGDLSGRRPLRPDDIFALASMTKPVVAAAVLTLLEEDKLLLGDPVEKYLPEFRGAKVAVPRPDAAGGYDLVALQRSITIHDLLIHRSGLATGAGPAAAELRAAMRGLPADAVLADHVKALAAVPLNFQPGAAWEYGPSYDVLGRVIEVVSGQPLDVFLRRRIFEPLRMVDTGFTVPPEKLPRLALIYEAAPPSGLRAARPQRTDARVFSGGGGLFSTAPDYLRFCQMLLNDGQLEGRRLLSRKSIELMTARHSDPIPLAFLGGQYYGLGVAVQKDGGDSGLLGSPGTFGWSGAYNTYFRIDPKEQLILILLVQRSPANNLDIQYGFQNTVMQAIAD